VLERIHSGTFDMPVKSSPIFSFARNPLTDPENPQRVTMNQFETMREKRARLPVHLPEACMRKKTLNHAMNEKTSCFRSHSSRFHFR
jgi:hypothetical protein